MTGGNGFKLKVDGFRLDERKNVFTMMVVKHRNMFPKEVVNVSLWENPGNIEGHS